jgi:hypothetical protein
MELVFGIAYYSTSRNAIIKTFISNPCNIVSSNSLTHKRVVRHLFALLFHNEGFFSISTPHPANRLNNVLRLPQRTDANMTTSYDRDRDKGEEKRSKKKKDEREVGNKQHVSKITANG